MSELDLDCDPAQLDLIDLTFSKVEIRSFVDIGACWGVNGGYSFHALERYEIERAIAIDRPVTALTRERAAFHPRLELIESCVADQGTLEQVGQVDCVFLFDVLFKQVAPDWREVLAAYGKRSRSLVIYNRNWYADRETVRLPDLPVGEYLRRVHHTDAGKIREWYLRHDHWNETWQKRWRDLPFYWQWGITPEDLIAELWHQEFRLAYFKSMGSFSPHFPNIRNDALIAVRRSP